MHSHIVDHASDPSKRYVFHHHGDGSGEVIIYIVNGLEPYSDRNRVESTMDVITTWVSHRKNFGITPLSDFVVGRVIRYGQYVHLTVPLYALISFRRHVLVMQMIYRAEGLIDKASLDQIEDQIIPAMKLWTATQT